MKILKETRKYVHVRMTEDELNLLYEAVRKEDSKKEKEKKILEYATWFYTSHIDISWQDEYSSWQTEWKNIHTKQSVSQSQVPDLMSGSIYRHRFNDIIEKNKKKLGY